MTSPFAMHQFLSTPTTRSTPASAALLHVPRPRRRSPSSTRPIAHDAPGATRPARPRQRGRRPGAWRGRGAQAPSGPARRSSARRSPTSTRRTLLESWPTPLRRRGRERVARRGRPRRPVGALRSRDSKGEARRFLEQGGVYVNNVRVEASDAAGPRSRAARPLPRRAPRTARAAPRGHRVIRRLGALLVCGTCWRHAERMSTGAALRTWVTQSNYSARLSTLRADARHSPTALEDASTTANELHTVCAVLHYDAEQANASLPTPDDQATKLLSTGLRAVRQRRVVCWSAGSSRRPSCTSRCGAPEGRVDAGSRRALGSRPTS